METKTILPEFGIKNPIRHYETKDSGKRQEYKSGMNRDLQEGKPRFELITPLNCSKESSMLYRWAMLMERGMTKYGYRNWEKANSEEELQRFKQSAMRHFMQWINDWDKDEDHASAVMFNIQAYEWLRGKLNEKNVG
jgi:hypothetical protein